MNMNEVALKTAMESKTLQTYYLASTFSTQRANTSSKNSTIKIKSPTTTTAQVISHKEPST